MCYDISIFKELIKEWKKKWVHACGILITKPSNLIFEKVLSAYKKVQYTFPIFPIYDTRVALHSKGGRKVRDGCLRKQVFFIRNHKEFISMLNVQDEKV